MKVKMFASAEQEDEIKNDLWPGNSDVHFSADAVSGDDLQEYDVLFFLNVLPPDETVFRQTAIVFVNEVVHTSAEMHFPGQVVRINGWPGFLQRPLWEAAGNISPEANVAVQMLGRKLLEVKDVPGLVAGRVVATIINEAFKALEEGVSTKEEIDLALKSGTNYPFGPFEWSEKIGREHVFNLLSHMATSDDRYSPLFQA